MFELSVAAKYLTPRWRQLSVSIISIISILVISLVVWLIVVFFSVTHGLTNRWVDKLIALTAPVRITPTEEYYHSYYYLVDSISGNSDYSAKSIHEKRISEFSDPYDDSADEEIPAAWPPAQRDANGQLIDPVKKAFEIIQSLQHSYGLKASDYEMSVANLRLRLVRPTKNGHQQGFLSHAAYLGSLDPENSYLDSAISPITPNDLQNVLRLIPLSSENSQEDAPDQIIKADLGTIRMRLLNFFRWVEVKQLRTPSSGWNIPRSLFSPGDELAVEPVLKNDKIVRFLVPLHKDPHAPALLTVNLDGSILLRWSDGREEIINGRPPLLLQGEVVFEADLRPETIERSIDGKFIDFNVSGKIQNIFVKGDIPMGELLIADALVNKKAIDATEAAPYWFYHKKGSVEQQQFFLPVHAGFGEGILIPENFRDSGALLGDTGFISYYSPTASTVQEQRIPVYIAGFYDPGIIPIGGKFMIVNQTITNQIRSSQGQTEALGGNGINVRLANRDNVNVVKKLLQQKFEEADIARFWKIETYQEFEFTRNILQQLASEKRLFTLLAIIIIVVACSNIVSMMIILVNDKKVEIGILRSMGATSSSIAMIFCLCGFVMGVMGSLIGTLAALFTLRNLHVIVDFISRLQGYEMFNPLYYGNSLPTTISIEALGFVMAATVIISLISGLVPAIKASWMQPSAILKAE